MGLAEGARDTARQRGGVPIRGGHQDQPGSVGAAFPDEPVEGRFGIVFQDEARHPASRRFDGLQHRPAGEQLGERKLGQIQRVGGQGCPDRRRRFAIGRRRREPLAQQRTPGVKGVLHPPQEHRAARLDVDIEGDGRIGRQVVQQCFQRRPLELGQPVLGSGRAWFGGSAERRLGCRIEHRFGRRFTAALGRRVERMQAGQPAVLQRQPERRGGSGGEDVDGGAAQRRLAGFVHAGVQAVAGAMQPSRQRGRVERGAHPQEQRRIGNGGPRRDTLCQGRRRRDQQAWSRRHGDAASAASRVPITAAAGGPDRRAGSPKAETARSRRDRRLTRGPGWRPLPRALRCGRHAARSNHSPAPCRADGRRAGRSAPPAAGPAAAPAAGRRHGCGVGRRCREASGAADELSADNEVAAGCSGAGAVTSPAASSQAVGEPSSAHW